jgi:hypothetical protein
MLESDWGSSNRRTNTGYDVRQIIHSADQKDNLDFENVVHVWIDICNYEKRKWK